MVGSKLEHNIISLFSNVKASYSILQISKKLNTSYPHVYNKVQELIKQGILQKIKIGPSHLCRINLENDTAIALLTLEEISKRDNWISSNKKGEELFSGLKELKREHNPLTLVYADGRIIMVFRNEKYKGLQPNIPKLGFPVDQLHNEDFIARVIEKNLHKQAIIIAGFETYFELLATAAEKLPTELPELIIEAKR